MKFGETIKIMRIPERRNGGNTVMGGSSRVNQFIAQCVPKIKTRVRKHSDQEAN